MHGLILMQLQERSLWARLVMLNVIGSFMVKTCELLIIKDGSFVVNLSEPL